jgi:hypothetical protein
MPAFPGTPVLLGPPVQWPAGTSREHEQAAAHETRATFAWSPKLMAGNCRQPTARAAVLQMAAVDSRLVLSGAVRVRATALFPW